MIVTDPYDVVDLTAPLTASTLGGMADLVEEFGLTDPHTLRDGWDVVVKPDLAVRMIARWDRVTVTVRERGDLALAIIIAQERNLGRQHVARVVSLARIALGWGRWAPMVRCVVCRTTWAATDRHVPASAECYDTLNERRIDHSS